MLITRHGSSFALRALAVVVALLLMGLNAHAATFSFASDDNHDGPTFQDLDVTGPPDVVEGMAPPDISGDVEVDFKIDTNGDAAGGLSVIPAKFEFLGEFISYSVTGVPAGAIPPVPSLHYWEVQGSYKFTDLSGALLKEVTFDRALLAAFSSSASYIEQTATIQGNSTNSGITATLGPGLTDRGIVPVEGDDFAVTNFAFTLTNLRTHSDGSPTVLLADRNPIRVLGQPWLAEGSYSATSTHLTPEPGTVLMLLTAGLIAVAGIRRRKR